MEPRENAAPAGKTLWEMFTGWTRKKLTPESDEETDGEAPNPLEWTPGVPVTLNVSHGPEFENALVIAESIRHAVRKLGRKEFGFIDYKLRITPRLGTVSHATVRCFPREENRWDMLLLRRYDEFGFDKDFVALLEDPSGIFNIDNPNPDQENEPSLGFARLNDLHTPWEVQSNLQLQCKQGGEPQHATTNSRYWDYSRETEHGEEFLFIEIDEKSGWTELWLGNAFRL